ncbi:uncharacterized protein [Ptychodera flava]|uniref:uncharacterized protein n=1 Tax=Ptychodera flava TaxID=63121 RepID=UPI00396A22A8
MAEAKRNVIKWTKTKYSLKKFTKNYKLPQIVKVMSGWCGNDEQETISSGQVLRVAKKFNQSRVVAEDDLGRHLSIPKDYRFKFNVLSVNEELNKTYTIEEILKEFTLPQMIQLAKEDGMFVCVDSSQKPDQLFGDLKLLRTHEITYLVCNAMNRDGIGRQPIILPMYIAIEVVVGEGLEKGTKIQWEDYQRLRTQTVESLVNFEEVKGNEDIAIYGSAAVTKKERAAKLDKTNIYEEIEPDIVQISTSRRSNRNLREGEGSTERNIGNDSIGIPIYSEIGEIEARPPRVARSQSFPANEHYTSLVSELRARYETLSVSRDPVKNHPSVAGSNEPANDKVNTNAGSTTGLAGKSRPKRKTITFPVRVRFDPKDGEPIVVEAPPAPPTRPTALSPSISPGPGQNHSFQACEANVAKFPSEVRGLSVVRVCQCLQELNLGQYAKTFSENDVDGDILCDLTPEIMQEDMGMKQLHARKLEKFIKGWRPNYGK